jgi:predicted Zn-dependent protease with MMP-like domain
MSSMHVTPSDFDRLVEQALAELPPEFEAVLDNVVVIVEEEPTDDDLELVENEDSELLGVYRGVARTRRTHDMLPMLPDQIAIFRGPILRVARDRHGIVREVRNTVIHELGHYFGLHDHEMPY